MCSCVAGLDIAAAIDSERVETLSNVMTLLSAMGLQHDSYRALECLACT